MFGVQRANLTHNYYQNFLEKFINFSVKTLSDLHACVQVI